MCTRYKYHLVIIGIALLLSVSDTCAQKQFWMSTNGPEGGIINDISSIGNGVILARVWYGGMFRSSDNGMHWINTDYWKYDNGQYGNTLRGGDGVIYSEGDSLLQSTNDGKNWLPVSGWPPVEWPFGYSSEIFLDSQLNIVFSKHESGTWRLSKDGKTVKLNNVEYYRPVRHPDGSVWAIGEDKILRTKNEGTIWDSVRYSYGPARIIVSKRGDIFVTEKDPSGMPKYFLTRTTDNGNTWTIVDTIYTTPGLLYCSVVETSDSELVRNDGTEIVVSEDNGGSWGIRRNINPNETYIYKLLAAADTIVAATDRGIYISVDKGLTWIYSSGGLSGTRTWSISTGKSILYSSSDKTGLFKSTDHGGRWNVIDTVSQYGVRISGVSPNGTIFVSASYPYWPDIEYRSSDQGITWARADSGLNNGAWIEQMIFVDTMHIYARGGGRVCMFRSTDGGNTWTLQADGMPDPREDKTDMAIDRRGNLYLTTLGGLFRSGNGMDSWEEIQGPVLDPVTDKNYTAIAVDADGTLYCAAGPQGIFKSVDSGTSWEQSTHWLERKFVHSLVIDENGFVYAGTEIYDSQSSGGVYRTTDKGRSWENISKGLTTGYITLLHLGRDGYLYAGSVGSGVFRSVDKITSVERQPAKTPSTVFDHGIYPSVLAGSSEAHIYFTLPQRSAVQIQIMDRLGRLMETLPAGDFDSGSHSIPFSTAGYRAGLYFYQILIKGKSYSKAFAVLR